MASYSYPGVYIQEVPGGPGPIVGSSPSTLALLGWTKEGKTDNPVLVSSFTEFAQKFGGFTASSRLPTAAFAYFQNGGNLLRVVRCVSADSVKSTGFLTEGKGGDFDTAVEVLTPDSAPDDALTLMTFLGANVLDNKPVLPGSSAVTGASIALSNGPGTVVLYDDRAGTGALVGRDNAGAAVDGATGSLDYLTGDVTLTAGVAFPAGCTFTASYSWKLFSFSLKYQGVYGNNFRVQVSGDPNFENLATSQYTRFVVDVLRNDSGDLTDDNAWVGLESFSGLSLTDPSDTNFIKTVINDEALGSEYISVATHGNDQVPTDLAGDVISGEAIVGVPTYDGDKKQIAYDLDRSCSPGSFSALFNLSYNSISLGANSGDIDGAAGAADAVSGLVALNQGIAGYNAFPHEAKIDALNTVSIKIPAAAAAIKAEYNLAEAAKAASTQVSPNGGVPAAATVANATTLTLVAGAAVKAPGAGFKLRHGAMSGGNAVVYDIVLNTAGADTATLVGQAIGAGALAGAVTGVLTYATGVVSLTYADANDAPANGQPHILVADAANSWIQAAVVLTDTVAITQQTLTNSGAAAALADVNSVIAAGSFANINSGSARCGDLNIIGGAITATNWAFEFQLGAGGAMLGGNIKISVETAFGAGGLTTDFVRAKSIKIVDDSNGALSIASDSAGDADISLNANGVNTIDYGNFSTQVATARLMWALSSNPTVGPTNLAAVTQVASYTTQPELSAAVLAMANGSDGAALAASSVVGAALAPDEKGIYALNKVDDILSIVIPDFDDVAGVVHKAMVDYCETRKDRFAILSVPEALSGYNDAVNYKKKTLAKNSSRAALYFPWVNIIDPVTNKEISFPPAAHVAGRYAYTDSVKNVSKAPAGTSDGVLSFITGVKSEFTPKQVGILNLSHVNSIVAWPYTGRAIWGARTLQAGGEFPYIQMRRLFMFLEKSVFNNTQSYVFENNSVALRSSVQARISSFLLGLFQQGYFQGATPAEAFFVICDSSNNTPQSIAAGLLYCDIGVAPTRPAEFVVFRFQQKALE